MKRKVYIIGLLLAALLSGCGKEIGNNEKFVSQSHDELELTTADETTTDGLTTADEDSFKITTTASSSKPKETTAAKTTTAKTTTQKPKPVPKPDEISITHYTLCEVYSRTTVKDMIVEINAELSEPDKLIDTSELGEHELKVKCIYDEAECEKTITYTVVDTTPPTLLNSGENTYISVGTFFNINNYVGYGDNYDRTPSIYYEGDVDSSTAGDYPLTVYLTDSSGNQTSYGMTVHVGSGYSTYADTYTRIGFGDFVNSYAAEGRSFGIDVSRWQGEINFNAVKNAGCDFVIMRIGIYSGGELSVDRYYYENIKNAKAAGLKVGVYFYSCDSSEESVREHARWIIDTLGGEKLDFPVAFDWENFEHYQNYGMSIHDLNEFYYDFKDELSKAGYDTMLYGSRNYLQYFWEHPDDEYVWLAHYVSQTNYEGRYNIWQRCAWGRIDGIYGDVDFDILYS